MTMDWKSYFTEREIAEIRFAQVYAQHYGHGTDGHNAKIIIAKLTAIIEGNHIENLPPFEQGKFDSQA